MISVATVANEALAGLQERQTRLKAMLEGAAVQAASTEADDPAVDLAIALGAQEAAAIEAQVATIGAHPPALEAATQEGVG